MRSEWPPPAFWASADALHMLHERLPAIGSDHRGEIRWRARRWWMPHGVAKGGRRVGLARICRAPILGRLAVWRWTTTIHLTEPGEWAHGCQFYASSVSEHHFRKTVVLAQSCPSDQAHLRSHSGGGCSHVLHGCPTSPEFTVAPDVFRTIVLERLRLPLPVTEAVMAHFGQSDFGQTDFGQFFDRLWPRRVGGPKFRAFFALSHRKFHSFFSLWWSSLEFWWFEAPGRSNVCVWSSLVVV